MAIGLRKLEELLQSSRSNIPLSELARLKDTFGLDTDLMFVELVERELNVIDEIRGEVHKLVDKEPIFISDAGVVPTRFEGLTRHPETGIYHTTEDKLSHLVEREIGRIQQSGTRAQKAEHQKLAPFMWHYHVEQIQNQSSKATRRRWLKIQKLSL